MTELRRHNLHELIDQRFDGKALRLAESIGRSPSYIYRIFAKNEKDRKNLGADLAREIEKTLNLPEFWFDQDHDHYDPFEAELLRVYRTSNDTGKTMLRVTAEAVRDHFNGSRDTTRDN